MTKRTLLVADTSVLLKWVNQIDEHHLPQARKLLDRFEAGKIQIIVPLLVKYEIGNALLKGKKLPTLEAQDALDAFSQLPLSYADIDSKGMSDTYEIANELIITFYDAAFLYLAQKHKATLVTDNPKHQKKHEGIRVIALKDYR